MKRKVFLPLILVLIGWIAYEYFLPDPIFPVPISPVTPEQAGLIWQECELPIPAQASNSPARDESVTCFGHPAPMLVDDYESRSVQSIDKTYIRMTVIQDVYKARANDLIALTVYTLYKNGNPVKRIVGLGDTLWLRMFLSNVNGHIAWGIANENPATIIYDGKDLRNVYGLDRAHAAYGLSGKLIFVGEKDGKFFIVYDAQKIGPDFDRITIGYCCETVLYTARGSQGKYQFRGTRGGKDYIVEINASPMASQEDDPARNSLLTFFTLLHNGRYGEASRFYGGDYQILRDDNPDVSSVDYALLLERACRQNGFMCLKMKSIVDETWVTTTEVRFKVEFVTPDGKLFVRGPCCGATETRMPSVSRFDFNVKKVGDSFLVQELPVYVP